MLHLFTHTRIIIAAIRKEMLVTVIRPLAIMSRTDNVITLVSDGVVMNGKSCACE